MPSTDLPVDVLGSAHRTAPPDPALLTVLDTWLPTRRWYPVKGVSVRHVPWVSFELPVRPARGAPDPPAGTRVVVHLLRLVGEGVELVVQVPLVLVPGSLPAPPGAPGGEPPGAGLVGHLPGDAPGDAVEVHDGATHPACWAALLRCAAWEAGVETGAEPDVDLAGGRAMTVEQSNSSVLLPATAGGTILKILRALAIGPNPDLTIPRALATSGWAGVPRPYASLTAAWDPVDVPAGAPTLADARTCDLAILSELVDGARDGFELACAYAGQDEPFTDLAAELGRVIADLHDALRGAFGTGPPVDVDWLVDDLRRRSREAVGRSTPLARRAEAIEAFWDRCAVRLAAAREAPRLQTVHGDLHLGQVLHARRFGWKVLDFEGEPLRPVAERTRPDLPLRDVAGILRSIDYAAAVGHAHGPRWAVQTRTAFLDAYEQAAPPGDREAAETLVRALVLDKALYEVVYESRNRPAWEPIPLAAVDRLLG